MSGTGEQPDPTREARTLLASANALVRELIEEGVSEFPRLPTTEVPAETRRTQLPNKRSTSPSSVQNSTRAAALATETEVARDVPSTKWTRSAEGERPTLDEVEAHLGDCTRCDLCQGRRSIVFGRQVKEDHRRGPPPSRELDRRHVQVSPRPRRGGP